MAVLQVITEAETVNDAASFLGAANLPPPPREGMTSVGHMTACSQWRVQ